jgi:hypothetical protein
MESAGQRCSNCSAICLITSGKLDQVLDWPG